MSSPLSPLGRGVGGEGFGIASPHSLPLSPLGRGEPEAVLPRPSQGDPSMSTFLTRRRVLQAAAVAGLAPASLLAEKKQPASERLNVAVIGTHNRAYANLHDVAAAANVVALCDVDEKLATKA